jgi:hypothetical protein
MSHHFWIITVVTRSWFRYAVTPQCNSPADGHFEIVLLKRPARAFTSLGPLEGKCDQQAAAELLSTLFIQSISSGFAFLQKEPDCVSPVRRYQLGRSVAVKISKRAHVVHWLQLGISDARTVRKGQHYVVLLFSILSKGIGSNFPNCTTGLFDCRLRLQFSRNEFAAGIVANAKDARLSFGFAEFDTS